MRPARYFRIAIGIKNSSSIKVVLASWLTTAVMPNTTPILTQQGRRIFLSGRIEEAPELSARIWGL
jgi:hypothetical protein